ncbi:MAG: ATP synthase F0 subunit B [Bacteriovoracaceae bacterium]
MRFWTAYAVLALGIITKAYGSDHGGGHHASITDLIAPAINVGILVGVLVWKLKKPLSDMFTKKAEEVANTIERANMKSAEAKALLEREEKKMASLSQELKVIAEQAESDVVNFEKAINQEVAEKTEKLKIDAKSKIEADRKATMDELNAELLDQVIAKTKTTIKTNKDYQTKVSTKLLQGL